MTSTSTPLSEDFILELGSAYRVFESLCRNVREDCILDELASLFPCSHEQFPLLLTRKASWQSSQGFGRDLIAAKLCLLVLIFFLSLWKLRVDGRRSNYIARANRTMNNIMKLPFYITIWQFSHGSEYLLGFFSYMNLYLDPIFFLVPLLSTSSFTNLGMVPYDILPAISAVLKGRNPVRL